MSDKKTSKGKIIFLAVLLVVVAYFVFKAIFPASTTPPAPQNGAKPATAQPAAAANAAAGAAAQAKAPASAQGAASASAFKQSNVNIDELLASIKEVDFDYALERETRDPMTPLVGDRAMTQLTTSEEGGAPSALNASAAQRLALNMVVTGIVWDKRAPIAVVNNEVVYPGYVFDSGIAVESIEPSRVLLRVGDSVIPKELEEQ